MDTKEVGILSIDDSRAVHAFLERSLAETRYRLTCAMSGREGIQKLKDMPESFSLVLLDWEMPEMTGPETLEALAAEGIQIPVIMITSKNNVVDIEMMLAQGAKEYVMKPFTPEILIEKIESVLGQP